MGQITQSRNDAPSIERVDSYNGFKILRATDTGLYVAFGWFAHVILETDSLPAIRKAIWLYWHPECSK